MTKHIIQKIVFFIILLPINLMASESSSRLSVTANVINSCEVNTEPLYFGAYNTQILHNTIPIIIRCNKGSSYTISIASNDYKMINGKNSLNYNIYINTTKQNPVKNSSQSMISHNLFSDIATGLNQQFNLYAEVPANQITPKGTYNGNITLIFNIMNTSGEYDHTSYRIIENIPVSINVM